jgi:hypothetical protein
MSRTAGDGPERRTVIRTGLAAMLAAAAGLPAATAASAAPRAARFAVPGKAAGPGKYGKAPAGPWDRFNLSPSSRTVRPVTARATEAASGAGAVRHAEATRARLVGAGASVTFDFGKEVGGFVTLTLGPLTDTGQILGLTYSELSPYISATASDGSNGGTNDEPAVRYAVPPGGRISTGEDTPVAGAGDAATAHPVSQLRGGFRYVTVTNETAGTVELTDVSVAITFAPNAPDLSAYPNYFYCDDESLNRIWYAGAYTVQTNIIAADQGRVWGAPALGWDNSARVGEIGDTVLVDGAKRDRTVWPGDLGISVLTDYVSLGDLETVRNSLWTLYNHQDATTGALPYAGPAVNFIGNSDAYHLWTLIGTAAYAQFSGDTQWVRAVYARYTKAISYITGKIDTDGLLNVTGGADWARTDSDGKNLEANAIMYRALVTAVPVAEAVGDSAGAGTCARLAAALKTAIDTGGYWDEAAGLYRDKPTGAGATLYPQDGNALAVWFGLVDSADRAAAISGALAARWTPVGALSPEKSSVSVHPFPGGMEVHAHFAAGRDTTALDLIRREWGYMLDAPQGTASTFWEGYRTDGTSDYGGSYMSAAHGWSTGPTSALTFHLLGIKPSDDGGPGYGVVPRPGDVRTARGRLVTSSGVITASWRAGTGGRFDLTVGAPAGVLTEVGVPVPEGGPFVVRLDGVRVWDGSGRAHGARRVNGHVHFTAIPGGTHTVTVRGR